MFSLCAGSSNSPESIHALETSIFEAILSANFYHWADSTPSIFPLKSLEKQTSN